MELYGSLADNLSAALESAKRHEGHPLRSETLDYWTDLLGHARARKAKGECDAAVIDPLVAQLELVVTQRGKPSS